MSTSHTTRYLASMACGMALFAALQAARADTVSAWDLQGAALAGDSRLAVGELATGDPLAGILPTLAPGGADPYGMSSGSDGYVAQSVASANYSSCQTNGLVPCISLNSHPQSCGCAAPPTGSAPEPGDLALLGIGLLGLLLSQARSERRAA